MRKLIIYILIGFFIIGCGNKTSKNNESSMIENESNKYIGLWESVKRPYPYRSHLAINLDSTFRFEYGACISYGFSNGTWILCNDTIVMTSNEIDSCMYLSHFSVDCMEVPSDSTEIVIETTIIDCEPQGTDDYIYFDNEEFYLEGDTLRHIIKKPKRCPEIRNDFYSIEKDTTANIIEFKAQLSPKNQATD